MKEIARSGPLHLYETSKGLGILENRETGVKSSEKSIVSLLSASDDWEPLEGDIKKENGTMSFRDELANLEDEVCISVGEAPVEKGELPPEPMKDEPTPSKEKDPETYGKDETP